MFTGLYTEAYLLVCTQYTKSIWMDGWAKAEHAYGVQATNYRQPGQSAGHNSYSELYFLGHFYLCYIVLISERSLSQH